jgi:peptide/nickel transport system permease protein
VASKESELRRAMAEPVADVPAPDGQPAPAVLPRSRWARVWGRHKLGVIGLVLFSAILVGSVFGPFLVPPDPNQQQLATRLLPVWSWHEGQLHVLGTDALGRDILARVFIGGRASLGVVFASLLLGGTIGMVVGMVAGFYGRWVDNALMRLVDAQLSVPLLILAMLISALLGTGFRNTVLTLGLASWPIYARLMRAEVLSIRNREFVEAGVAVGASDMRLMWSEILPNVISSFTILASLELGRMVLIESSLSFLGLGMQPPDASWGSMIRDGQTYVYSAWWLSTVPGVFIMLTVLGLNFVGDWLRDVFDPRTR